MIGMIMDLLPLGLREWIGFNSWIRRRPAEGITSLAPTTCSSTASSASPSTRRTSGSGSSRPRSNSASSTRGSAARSSTTSSTSPSAARSPSPAPRLGEHINENWEDLVGPSNRSLVHWLRRLVFRGAWLDQRVKEGELDVVFDERTQTFGYVQPDRSARADRALQRAVLAPHRLPALAGPAPLRRPVRCDPPMLRPRGESLTSR